MALKLSSNLLRRSFLITYRTYCEKSVYQKLEEGEKERTVYGQPYPDWRRQWIKREGEWKSKLNIFVEKSPSPDVLNMMQKAPDLNLQKIKDWWAWLNDVKDRQNQIYMIQRVEALGPNLAAMHFFTFRGAAVRLANTKEWLKGPEETLKMPTKFKEGYLVEAIDCESFKGSIRYEGVENLIDLNFLKWLSLKNNVHVDEWCLDRIAGQNGGTLQYLDISGCKYKVGGIHALARMPALKYLVITDPGDDPEMQTALSILEDERPGLLIKAISSVDEQNLE